MDLNNYLTTKEYAEKHGKNYRTIINLCQRGKINCTRFGKLWIIPKDEPYPKRKAYTWENPNKNRGNK